MTIKLVSFPLCPFVQRAVITLLEKGIEHEIEYIDLQSPPDWFKQRSPLGKVPLLLVDDEVLFESAVILDYLDAIYPPRLNPEDPLLKAQHRAWISFGSELLAQLHGLAMADNSADFHQRLQRMQTDLRYLDQPIEQGLFAGRAAKSLVDAAFAPLFLRISILSKYRPEVAGLYSDNVADWADKLLARPSSRGSVVPDFESRFVDFFREKGSWALAKEPGVR
jgi:glutathione S-transferase